MIDVSIKYVNILNEVNWEETEKLNRNRLFENIDQHSADLWTCCVGSSESNLVHSCVFLPQVSTAVRTSTFSSVGALNGLYVSHRHREGFWQHQVLRGVGG